MFQLQDFISQTKVTQTIQFHKLVTVKCNWISEMWPIHRNRPFIQSLTSSLGLSREDRAAINSSSMSTSKVPIACHISLIQKSISSASFHFKTHKRMGQQLRWARGVPPVPHKSRTTANPGQDSIHPSTHAVIGIICDALALASWGIGVGVDCVSFLDERERKERGADLRIEWS